MWKYIRPVKCERENTGWAVKKERIKRDKTSRDTVTFKDAITVTFRLAPRVSSCHNTYFFVILSAGKICQFYGVNIRMMCGGRGTIRLVMSTVRWMF